MLLHNFRGPKAFIPYLFEIHFQLFLTKPAVVGKSLVLSCLAVCSLLLARAQSWQQKVDFRIDVTLNDKEHSLDAFEKITYSNLSPDTLTYIWFHCWPNAYKNDRTAFSEQLLLNNRTDFYFSNKDQRGYINKLDFKVDGQTARATDHPQYIDVIKLWLPKPLLPGATATISTPFHVQLPENFSRGGHSGQSYQVTQWFPKPAVYDLNGWHPMPYLDQGEFYAEFGHYDVRITLPENYAVAATGQLQDESEQEWLRARSNFSWEPVVSKTTVKKGSYHQVKKTIQEFPASAATTKTIRFSQDSITDFAWFADKRYRVLEDSIQLPSGKMVQVRAFFLPGTKTPWNKATNYLKKALAFRSKAIGEYPFATLTAVEAKMGFSGGMEYPTITSISPANTATELEMTIEHEAGHNWFQGMLASNERDYPWMDEGINSYYDDRYEKETESKSTPATKFPGSHIPSDPVDLILQSLTAVRKDQPINTRSEDFSELNYAASAYHKTAEWMKLLELTLGKSVFDSCMQAYFRQWQFKHPGPQDFKRVVDSVSGKRNDELFALLDKKGSLTAATHKAIKPTGFFNFQNTNKNSYLNLLPAIGYNQYDGFMIGLMAHNYSLPATKFRFLLAPLYATGSSNLNYLARASYSWYPKQTLYKAELGIAAASFSADAFQPANGTKLYLGFRKFAPFVKLSLPSPDARKHINRYLQFTSFLINENGLDFKTVISGPDTNNVVNKTNTSRYLNQLKLVSENNRALYPYRAELLAEQANGFVRLAFTGNYYFNYANNKSGLRARLFAGKFIYTGAKTISKQFETDRYHLNMSGANGNEDYTYSNYFVGRNAFEGTASHQIMMRDGGFKVRSELLSSKIGKTDNWLLAANLVSDLGNKKFPIKVFADIGTYSDAWQNNAQVSRFIFDAGLQLSLLHETVNIYLPLVYSSVFRDYYKSTLGPQYLFKSISFSIDIQRFRLGSIDKSLDF